MSSKIEEIKQNIAHKTREKYLIQARKRKSRSDMRKKAKRSITDLKEILTEIGNLDKSENDYALIFQEDKPYFDMLEVCNSAYSESYKSIVKLRQNSEEFLDALQFYSIRIGLKVLSKKQLSDRRFQNQVIDAMKKNPKEYQSFCEYFRRRVSEEPEKRVEELFKKELHLERTNSGMIDLYSEGRETQIAFQVASQVYSKLREGDKEFAKKTIEQVRHDLVNNKSSSS
jgi:hypothetical protein